MQIGLIPVKCSQQEPRWVRLDKDGGAVALRRSAGVSKDITGVSLRSRLSLLACGNSCYAREQEVPTTSRWPHHDTLEGKPAGVFVVQTNTPVRRFCCLYPVGPHARWLDHSPLAFFCRYEIRSIRKTVVVEAFDVQALVCHSSIVLVNIKPSDEDVLQHHRFLGAWIYKCRIEVCVCPSTFDIDAKEVQASMFHSVSVDVVRKVCRGVHNDQV
mmetsp:Transcript_52829/g.123600  ORF Transcript_52829/g.123600 Transcript_52829/m.123600 type:complete len:214 (-) Transcript_52829:440-1081(-)